MFSSNSSVFILIGQSNNLFNGFTNKFFSQDHMATNSPVIMKSNSKNNHQKKSNHSHEPTAVFM